MEPAKRPLFPIYDIMEHWAAFAHGTPEVKCQHHALYLALVNLCKVKGGSNRFALSYQHGMEISGIGSRNTYTAALKELEAWGFLTYTPGANGLKPPILAVHFCASAEHLLSIYRASASTPADTSAGHNKEVIRLRLEVEEKAATILELEEEVAALKAELSGKPAQPLPTKPAQAMAVAATDPEDEKPWTKSQLIDARLFQIICDDNGYSGIDYGHYRTLFTDIARSESPQKNRTAPQWRSFVRNCLTNQSKYGPLQKAALVDLSQPTPKDQLPPVGTDCTGRHIVLPNTGDANMNRMFAANYQRDFPGAIIHQTR